MQENLAELNKEQIEEFRRFLYERENALTTIQKYMADIRTFFRYLDGNFIVSKQVILEYKEWLIRYYAVNSVNSMLAALNQFLEFLGFGFLKVKRIRIQRSFFLQEEKELTIEEYQKLLKTAMKEGKEQLALCMETMASTGVRISELNFFTVEGVRKEHIEILNKGKYRKILLPKELQKKLLRYAKQQGIESGVIFITRNGKLKSRSSIWREMKALKEKAGIDGQKIFPHNLRHLFARLYYEVTKDLTGLGDLLGHSSLNVTRIYTSSTGEIYRKRLELMSRTKRILLST